MIVKVAEVTGDWSPPPETGKYFAVAYKNLTYFAVNSNTPVGEKITGVATLAEAVSEYTIANGYFNYLSSTLYYPHDDVTATTLAPLQGNWEWDSYEDYLIQIRGTKLTEWFDDGDGTCDLSNEDDMRGELGDIVEHTSTSQTSGILYVKIIDNATFNTGKYIAVAWKNLTVSGVSFLTTGGAGNTGYDTLNEVKAALNNPSNDSQFPAASFHDFELK
jgi:hypothetical protein